MSNTIDQRIHRRPTEQLRPRPVRRPAEPEPTTVPVPDPVDDEGIAGESRGHALTGLIFRVLGRSWRRALLGGALLAQIGEFSFVLAAVGHVTGVITDDGYQLALSVIAVTLIAGPAWLTLVSRRTGQEAA